MAGQPPRVTGAVLLLLSIIAMALGACVPNSAGDDSFSPEDKTFFEFTEYPISVGNLPVGFDVADVDNNGDLDIAVANKLSQTITLLTNIGFPAFSATEFFVSGQPTKVLFGDFDGTGSDSLDFVAYTIDNDELEFFFNGVTGFSGQSPSLILSTVGTVHSIEAVDLSGGSGAADLVMTLPGESEVLILINDDTGAFTATTVPLCRGANKMLAEDFDGDTDVDLAVVCKGDHTVRILLQQVIDEFTEEPVGGYTVGSAPVDIASADIDGDLVSDLVTANFLDASVSVLWGIGAGVFSVQTFTVSNFPEHLVTGLFDGLNQSIAVTHDDDTIVTLLGDGSRAVPSVRQIPVSEDPIALITGDFAGNTELDLISVERVDRILSVMQGNGGGGFSRTVIGYSEIPTQPRRVDFDGSGKDDVVLLQQTADRIIILQNPN